MSGEEKKVYTKGVLSSEISCASTGKTEVCCIPKCFFRREKKGKTYTPKSLPGVRARPLRTALVKRFWPPVGCLVIIGDAINPGLSLSMSLGRKRSHHVMEDASE